MTHLVIEEYRPSDEGEVLEVLRLALGESQVQPRSPQLWRWKHLANPFGPSSVLLARVGGQLAGVRAYLQWRFITGNRELVARRAVDTATHPDYLRRGIFRTLTMEANRRAEAEGVDLIFNTPNQKSLPGYLSMGWGVVGKPRVYVKWLRPGSLIRRSFDHGPPPPGEVIPAGLECQLAGDISDRAPLGLRTPRSADYLRWRYEQHPTVPYRMVRGKQMTVVVRPNRRSGRVEGVLSEIFIEGEGDPGPIRLGAQADYLVASARPGSPEARRLLRSGFLPAPGRGLTLMALPLSSAGRVALSLSAWDLSAGDLELL